MPRQPTPTTSSEGATRRFSALSTLLVAGFVSFSLLHGGPSAASPRVAGSEETGSEEAGLDDDASGATLTTTPEGRPIEPLISLSLRDADLAETLRGFAKIGNFNLILDPSVSGKVTVELRNVPWYQAMEQILKINGLGLDVVGGQRIIGTPSALAEQRRRLATVQRIELEFRYLDASRLAAVLQHRESGLLTTAGTAEASERRRLVLRDTGVQLLRLAPLLQRLDTPQAAAETSDALAQRATTLWQALQDRDTNSH